MLDLYFAIIWALIGTALAALVLSVIFFLLVTLWMSFWD